MSVLDVEMMDSHVGPIQLRRGGTGPSLVYLHSASGEGDGLELLDLLAAHFEVIAPMFPGFGDSEGIDRIDDMDEAALHLLDVFDRLNLLAPALVGVSLGGWMAAEVASRYPDRVRRMVLVNPAGLHLPGAPVKDIFGRSAREMAPDLFFDQHHPLAELMLARDRVARDPAATLTIDQVRPVYQAMAATARLGWDPYLHDPKLMKRLWRVASPTLVVRATGDTLIPEAHARRYVAEIRGARYTEIADAAHLVAIERPDALAAVIVRFLA